MASSTLALPTAYHKPATGLLRKVKPDANNVRSEDELLKFFLHGSYDVQRGTKDVSTVEEQPSTATLTPDDSTTNKTLTTEEKKSKSRCMFEETYMINISVKQPDALPTSKQIDVRIEKAPTDVINVGEAKVDDDEISSIFDEDENDEIESVVFNEIPPTINERPSTPLTLADMITKTLTTIPTVPTNETNSKPWFPDKPVEEIKAPEKRQLPVTKPTSLTTSRSEDEKLIQYLDYLETKEDSAVVKPAKTEPTKKTPIEPIPIIDLEQLCRSLTVNDLKDESIRKKIQELKVLIDQKHKKGQNQSSIMKTRKDPLPVLIAMPANRPQNHQHQSHHQAHHHNHHQQQQQQQNQHQQNQQQQQNRQHQQQPQRIDNRRTTNGSTSTLLQSKTVNNFQKPSVASYQDILSSIKTPPSSLTTTSSTNTGGISTQINGAIFGRRIVNQFVSNNVNRKPQFT